MELEGKFGEERMELEEKFAEQVQKLKKGLGLRMGAAGSLGGHCPAQQHTGSHPRAPAALRPCPAPGSAAMSRRGPGVTWGARLGPGPAPHGPSPPVELAGADPHMLPALFC